MTKTWRALYARVGAFSARIEENVGGIRVVKAFANEPYEREMFARENAKYRETKLEAYKIMAASHSLSYLGMRLIQIIVMMTGSYFVIQGELTPGGFVAFLLLVNVFFRPLEKINAVIELYPKGIAGFSALSSWSTPSLISWMLPTPSRSSRLGATSALTASPLDMTQHDRSCGT